MSRDRETLRGPHDLDIRRATEEDAESIAPLWQSAFNLSASWLTGFRDRFHPERVLVAARGSRILATAQAWNTNQWYGGQPVRMAGVASVATDPMVRGTGIGPQVVTRLLREARDAGHAVSSLYPSTIPFYRRLGFELGGVYTLYRLALGDIPLEPPSVRQRVELAPVSEEMHERLRSSFRRLAERENGVVEGLDEDWWRVRVLGRHSAEEPGGTVATGEDVPDAYASYRQERSPERWGYRLVCQHLVAHTRRSALGLLAFFRRFKGVGEELRWAGPPIDPLTLLVAERSIEPEWRFAFMTRILDIPAALEGRGYPPHVEGETLLAVEDPLFEENTATFRVEAGGGKVRVTRHDDHPNAAPVMSIGALSTMYTAYVTPWAAARAGLIDPDHPGIDLLADLFAGPPPWTPDFF